MLAFVSTVTNKLSKAEAALLLLLLVTELRSQCVWQRPPLPVTFPHISGSRPPPLPGPSCGLRRHGTHVTSSGPTVVPKLFSLMLPVHAPGSSLPVWQAHHLTP